MRWTFLACKFYPFLLISFSFPGDLLLLHLHCFQSVCSAGGPGLGYGVHTHGGRILLFSTYPLSIFPCLDSEHVHFSSPQEFRVKNVLVDLSLLHPDCMVMVTTGIGILLKAWFILYFLSLIHLLQITFKIGVLFFSKQAPVHLTAYLQFASAMLVFL